MQESPRAYVLKLFGWIALFVALGAPLVAWLWETLNGLLAGHFDALRVAISVPVLAVLYVLLILLARFVQRLDAPQTEAAPSVSPPRNDPAPGPPPGGTGDVA
jgi:uncharacterized Tic20 family protein